MWLWPVNIFLIFKNFHYFLKLFSIEIENERLVSIDLNKLK